MVVMYLGKTEVIVCDVEDEAQMKQQYFKEQVNLLPHEVKRRLKDYTREESPIVCLKMFNDDGSPAKTEKIK